MIARVNHRLCHLRHQATTSFGQSFTKGNATMALRSLVRTVSSYMALAFSLHA